MTGAQIVQRVRMRTDKVADVDVIADAGAIGRRIIGTVDVELGPKPERCLDGDLNQWVAFLLDWPVRQCGSAPATLK
jgi:hypothetical protein